MADADYFANPSVAMGNAMRKTNAQLHGHAIDDSLSGTTAVVALLKVWSIPSSKPSVDAKGDPDPPMTHKFYAHHDISAVHAACQCGR